MAASTSAQASFPPAPPSAAARLPLERQVFISHTGQDDGAKTFAASILRPTLEAAGLEVCMDFFSLEPGCQWPEELVKAAANSMVVVVVLSKSYTKRFWCMLELDLALNSHHHHQQQGGEGGSSHSKPLVIPVFYDSPDDIKKGEDAVTIQQFWEGVGLAKLPGPEWAPMVDAPRWAANITAMKGVLQNMRRKVSKEAEKDEELQLARRVVKAAVKHIPSLVDVGVEVVGFEEQEAAVAAQLGGPDRLGVWLYGQGGRGKSTLAKVLFNRLAGSFPHSAFVEIQEGDSQEKTPHLLVAALKALGALGALGEAAEGAAVLSRRLKGFVRDRKVLLVLDNVWTASQLNALLPTAWGEGSTVIVTSRYARLTVCDVWRQVQKRLHQHEVAVLDEGHSRQLFRRAAGLEGGLDASLLGLEEAILKICGGLPLALQLLGGQLYEDTEVVSWQGALAALQKGSPVEDSEGRLKGVLLHSLAGLDPVGVSMFLDAATFMRGWDLKGAMKVWTAWHGPASAAFFKELTRRCLVGVVAARRFHAVVGDVLLMHDVLVVLGRGVVLSETPGLEGHWGNRVWTEGGKVVGRQQGRKVLAASLDYHGMKPEGEAEVERASVDLVSSPDLSEARMLLGMKGAWPCHGLATLRVLDVQDFLGAALPDAFTQLTALQSLSVQGSHITALPESFGRLAALQTLNLSRCGLLAALPESFDRLAALQALNLSECEQLAALPESFGCLAALQTLNLNWCRQLTALPESFGRLAALQALNLSECKQLAALPESFGRLAALQTLDLSGCEQLTALPESFGRLAALQTLVLRGCWRLTALPESFGQLAALTSLIVLGCESLAALPDFRGGLGALRELDIEGCTSLVAVPAFNEHPRLRVTYDPHHLVAAGGEARAWYGGHGGKARETAVSAATPPGCWVAQWRVWSDRHVGVISLQGVLNDGTHLPALNSHTFGLQAEVVGGEGGGFTEVYGRAKEEGLAAFMGCGKPDKGEAWTFKCPPGHRIVGYAGAAEDGVKRVCFLTAEFQGPAEH